MMLVPIWLFVLLVIFAFPCVTFLIVGIIMEIIDIICKQVRKKYQETNAPYKVEKENQNEIH